MVKNALEPQCFKWWEFPSIPGYYFSVRIFENDQSILYMKKPADMTQYGEGVFEAAQDGKDVMEADWCVLEADLDSPWAESWLSEDQLKTIYKHFGIPTNDGSQKEKPRNHNPFSIACHALGLLEGRALDDDYLDRKATLKVSRLISEIQNELLGGDWDIDALLGPVRCTKPLIGFDKQGMSLAGGRNQDAKVACFLGRDGDLKFTDKIDRKVYLRELGRYLEDAGVIEIDKNLGVWYLRKEFFPNLKSPAKPDAPDHSAATPFFEGCEGICFDNEEGMLPFEPSFDLKKDFANYVNTVRLAIETIHDDIRVKGHLVRLRGQLSERTTGGFVWVWESDDFGVSHPFGSKNEAKKDAYAFYLADEKAQKVLEES